MFSKEVQVLQVEARDGQLCAMRDHPVLYPLLGCGQAFIDLESLWYSDVLNHLSEHSLVVLREVSFVAVLRQVIVSEVMAWALPDGLFTTFEARLREVNVITSATCISIALQDGRPLRAQVRLALTGSQTIILLSFTTFLLE